MNRVSKNDGYQISVIMPVHDTGVYLEEALDSLFNQTFSNFEVICVDDASSDRLTINTLEHYQLMWKQMRVIWLQEQVGAAEARNVGLGESSGSYVIFLDSDDIFHQDMLAQMNEQIVTTNSDICFCGFRSFSFTNILHENLFSKEVLPRIYDNEKQNRPEDWLVYNWKVPWNKLCKKKFLIENNILFQTLESGNDLYFSCLSEIKAERVCFCNKAMVDYRVNYGSQITTRKDIRNLYYAIERLLEDLQLDRGNDLYTQIVIWLLWSMVFELSMLRFDDKSKIAYHIVQEFIKKEKNNIQINNKFYQYIFQCFQNKPYESQWYRHVLSFEIQYQIHADEIRETLKGYSKIVLWGMGIRGQAFQHFCQSENISIWGCTDIKNNRVDSHTRYDIPIISTNVVADNADFIVACNENIYQFVREKLSGKPVINLQKYEAI